MGYIKKTAAGIDKLCKTLMFIFITVISSVLFIQIVARFVFHTGTSWTDELARFSTIWLVFIGAAVATKDRSLINVDVLSNFFPKTEKILRKFQSAVFLILCIILIKMSWETMLLVSEQRSPNIGLSMSVVYLALPVSMVITAIHLIIDLIDKEKVEEHNHD